MDQLTQIKMIRKKGCLIAGLLCLVFSGIREAPAQEKPVFQVVPLGVYGGLNESDLSSYMAGAAGSTAYVCLDAGTLYTGIEQAIRRGVFQVPESTVLRQYIKGYLISHGHLDHLAGLVLNAPDDTNKPIYGLPFCIRILQQRYFNWDSWANFADKGDAPRLAKYHYVALTAGQEFPVRGTGMQGEAYELSHGHPYKSTAFLLRKDSAYLLYLGDTGADSVERSDKLHLLWERIAPLLREKKLRALFIEVSYSDAQPEGQLYGHLTPRLFGREMADLEKLAGRTSLQGLPVVITHIKPFADNEAKVKNELKRENTLGLALIFPRQGVPMMF